MADDTFASTITIQEIEGAMRWRLTLHGRAIAMDKDKPIEVTTESRAEVTKYRGRSTHAVEHFGPDYGPLEFAGRWSLLHLATGDSKVDTFPHRELRTPQAICDFVELFLKREKIVEVTWSGGFTRITHFKKFTWSPGRAGDRKWHMSFEVIGTRRFTGDSLPELLTAPMALSMLTSAARALDEKLGNFPTYLSKGFLNDVLSKFSLARETLAGLRRAIATVGDFTRAPVAILNETSSIAESAMCLFNDALDEFEKTPLVYQSTYLLAETTFEAYRWKQDVKNQTGITMDAILKVIAMAETLTVQPKKYLPVQAGANLARIAHNEYGLPDLWVVIAEANKLSSQIVPQGVSTLLIPEV